MEQSGKEMGCEISVLYEHKKRNLNDSWDRQRLEEETVVNGFEILRIRRVKKNLDCNVRLV